MSSVGREELYAWCGRSRACRKAVDYYLMYVQNPCYPPAEATYKIRKFYRELVMRYGPPPQCDIKALVAERLRGTPLEMYIDEIAELAEALKKRRNATSRVAAAAATAAVAEARGVKVGRVSVAARFGVSGAAVRLHIRDAAKLYMEMRKRGVRPAP